MSKEKEGKKVSSSFATGVIALVFLAVGYQTALFIHNAAITGIAAGRDSPDTVFIISSPSPEASSTPGTEGVGMRTVRKSSRHSKVASAVRRNTSRRSYECFEFDPNTASVEDLQRLGFSEKQALSIEHYREKGGRFRRKEDFAKSYVVADSVFKRLEPYINIPKLDINQADSAAFDALPGIGPYFAARMVEYRNKLGGYSDTGQLMEIKNFDQERFDALSDLITAGPSKPYPIWTLPEDSLHLHPYIGSRAHGIVLYREHNPPSVWTVAALEKAGVLSHENADKLARCRLESPEGAASFEN